MLSTSTVVYFKQGLGNLILLTPALQALAEMDKSHKVDICFSSEWRDTRRASFEDLVSNFPFVQDIINYPAQRFTKSYNVWFYTLHSEFSEAFDVFRNQPSGNPLSIPDWKGSQKHEAVWYFEHVLAMGCDREMPKLFVPRTGSVSLPVDKLNIGICNGTYCNTMKGAKQWPYFKELSAALKQSYDCNIITIGTGDELQDVEADFNFVNKLSFTKSADVISKLDLFVVNDTANMHVGDAVRVPMVVIFGGSFVAKNAPLSSSAFVVRKGLDCQPCQLTESFKTCEMNSCLTSLSVGDVFAVCEKVLKTYDKY